MGPVAVSCRPMDVSVLGSGSWGTALAILLARNGHEVTLIGRSATELTDMKATHHNHRYLPDFNIPHSVSFRSFEDEPVHSEMTVIAVPSSSVREITRNIDNPKSIVVVAAKGLESGSAMTMCEVAHDVLGSTIIGSLSGPNLAVEIARGIPTVAMAAFDDHRAAETVRDVFSCRTFRISTTSDVRGVELAGALKNVLAIGAGMSDGLGFGDNTKGAFLSRGLLEMARLGVAMGAQLETFLGPAGVGDLFATAASKLSRNYRLGRALGEGQTLESALASLGQVAEGVPTSQATGVLAVRNSVEMPVFAAVEAVLRGRIEPKTAVGMLMERTSRMGDFNR